MYPLDLFIWLASSMKNKGIIALSYIALTTALGIKKPTLGQKVCNTSANCRFMQKQMMHEFTIVVYGHKPKNNKELTEVITYDVMVK